MKTAVVVKGREGDGSKWTHMPIGMPYWNGGPWKWQPKLAIIDRAFARENEPPPKSQKREPEKGYEVPQERVMF
jgi:hypothetical protein